MNEELRGLVAKWRDEADVQAKIHARQGGFEVDWTHDATCNAKEACADELESLLAQPEAADALAGEGGWVGTLLARWEKSALTDRLTEGERRVLRSCLSALRGAASGTGPEVYVADDGQYKVRGNFPPVEQTVSEGLELADRSLPFARDAAEAVIACLEDDASALRDANVEDERAVNMERAAVMLQAVLDRVALSAAPVAAQQPAVAGDGRKCAECHGFGERCLAGHSAHAANWHTCERCKGTGVQELVRSWRDEARMSDPESPEPFMRGAAQAQLKCANDLAAALAQPDQSEPVGHIVPAYDDPIMAHVGMVEMLVDEATMPIGTKLYTHPDRTQASGEWVLVPREPTHAMVMAGWESGRTIGDTKVICCLTTAYAAMIAAAPTPPSVPGKGGGR